jgi:hypothetical protein
MVTAQGNESGKRQSFWVSLFDWRMSDQELRRQLENYGALGWTWSYRKLSAALIWFSLALTVLFWILGYVHAEAVALDVVVYLALSFFVYRGHRWALIAAMALWTVEKGYQLAIVVSGDQSQVHNILTPIIFWAIYTGVFWKAYRVESARHKLGSRGQ